MSGQAPETSSMAGVTVRYWAAAKAAAGVESDLIPVTEPTTLAAVLSAALTLHKDRPRLEDVIGVCSVLLGDRPVGAIDPEEIAVEPGDVVQLLPPFAGG
ncbi:MAG TPA: MoaD/ThiS family protein [Nocardioidaceae bacterium]|nr:MoaD/ThiS family protein [Nocardioidaceae bacterium]